MKHMQRADKRVIDFYFIVNQVFFSWLVGEGGGLGTVKRRITTK